MERLNGDMKMNMIKHAVMSAVIAFEEFSNPTGLTEPCRVDKVMSNVSLWGIMAVSIFMPQQ